MAPGLKTSLKGVVNSFLRNFDFEVRRIDNDVDQYIKFREHQIAAKNKGLPIGDYIESIYDKPGSSQSTIDELKKLNVFDGSIKAVCEIGPGSGRYLEKVIRLCEPEIYYIYETASEWRDWLTKEYNVIPCITDGINLSETQTQSMDLVHANKVFSTIGLFEILSYFPEVARIVKVGGKLFFDVITENCVDEIRMMKWLQLRANWPKTFLPKNFVVDYFRQKGFRLDGSFLVTQEPLLTECLVFTRIQNANL